MAEVRVNLYEGLFLLNQQAASADFAGCVEFIRQVFQRAEAELIVLRRWEERKLAFEVKGQKRGVFLLAYFKTRGTQIANIERDCNLSDQVLRALIIKADHIGDTELDLAKKDADLSLEAKLRSPEPPRRDAETWEQPEEGARKPKPEGSNAPVPETAKSVEGSRVEESTAGR
jgi:small subunit ribosomal protein S6